MVQTLEGLYQSDLPRGGGFSSACFALVRELCCNKCLKNILGTTLGNG